MIRVGPFPVLGSADDNPLRHSRIQAASAASQRARPDSGRRLPAGRPFRRTGGPTLRAAAGRRRRRSARGRSRRLASQGPDRAPVAWPGGQSPKQLHAAAGPQARAPRRADLSHGSARLRGRRRPGDAALSRRPLGRRTGRPRALANALPRIAGHRRRLLAVGQHRPQIAGRIAPARADQCRKSRRRLPGRRPGAVRPLVLGTGSEPL